MTVLLYVWIGLLILWILMTVLHPLDLHLADKKWRAWREGDNFWLDNREWWVTQPFSGFAMTLYDLIHRRKKGEYNGN